MKFSVFVFEELTKQYIRKEYPKVSHMNQSLIAGSVAGLASLTVQVPMDILKIRAQMTKDGKLSYRHEIQNVLRE